MKHPKTANILPHKTAILLLQMFVWWGAQTCLSPRLCGAIFFLVFNKSLSQQICWFKAFFPAMLMEFCYLVPDKSQKTHGTVHFAQCKGFRNLEKFCLWNPEPWALESGIQLKESEILQRNGIQNPSSTDKDWNQVPGIWNPRRGIQNPRLSWIPLYGAIYFLHILKS